MMCVWQALYARDKTPHHGPKTDLVKSLTASFSLWPAVVVYREKEFDETFNADTVCSGVVLFLRDVFSLIYVSIRANVTRLTLANFC